MRIWAGARVGHHAWLGGRLDRSTMGMVVAWFGLVIALGLARESGVLAALGLLH